MTISQILVLAGVLCVGAVIVVFVMSLFESKIARQKTLLEARVQAYTRIAGRLFNLFQEPDLQGLPDSVLFTSLNRLLSEVLVVASHKLAEHIGQFKTKVYGFHIELAKKNDGTAAELHKELLILVSQIYDQMRKEIHADGESLFDDNRNTRRCEKPK